MAFIVEGRDMFVWLSYFDLCCIRLVTVVVSYVGWTIRLNQLKKSNVMMNVNIDNSVSRTFQMSFERTKLKI